MRNKIAAIPVALLLLFALLLTACTGPSGTESDAATATDLSTDAESRDETESETERASESESESGTESATESQSETDTESGTETDTESDTETEPEIETVPEAEAGCYTLTYYLNDRGRVRESKTYYRSVADAVAANPAGADIWLCREASEQDRRVTFPETGEFSLHTVQFGYDFRESYQTGAVYDVSEHYFTEQAYFTSFSALLSYFSEYADYKMPLAGYSVWLLSPTDGYEPGKYYVTEGEDGFAFERECGPEYWGMTPVFSIDTRVFYTMAQVQAYLADHPTVQTVHVINAVTEEEPVEFPFGRNYRLAYDGNRVDLTFVYGATFDDGSGGLCYYSDILALCTNPQIVIRNADGEIVSSLYIWTGEDGYLPGKYRICDKGDFEEEYDEETELTKVFIFGSYAFVWTDTLDSYDRTYLQ